MWYGKSGKTYVLSEQNVVDAWKRINAVKKKKNSLGNLLFAMILFNLVAD